MKNLYLPLVMVLIALGVKAQKLPEVQANTLPAPQNIKIDGKDLEWGDNFAAENKRTSLFYSMANDEKNLYLIIKGSGSGIISKIMAGGITFNVNTEGKKKEKGAFSVTYPLIKRQPRQQGGNNGGRQGGGQGGQGGMIRVEGAGGFGGGGNFGGRQGQGANTAQRDSMMRAQQKTQLATVKEIKISGFQSITDSTISIYNEYGIKAVANIDAKGNLIYELAIPLQLLNISADNAIEIAYQLKVNGFNMQGFGGGGNFGGGGRGGDVIVAGGAMRGGGNFGGGGRGSDMQDMMSTTDFWAKYTLFKK